jgi:hypothetical protein
VRLLRARRRIRSKLAEAGALAAATPDLDLETT